MTTVELEKTITQHLADQNLEPDQLKKITASVAKLQSASFVLKRIYWKGQPKPDEILLHGRASLKDLSFFKELFALNNIVKIEGFPLGIPVLDELSINVKMGGF